MRSPDLSWVLRERLAALSPEQKRGFLPLVPDVLIELASPSDDPERLRRKMDEWLANGAGLGWLTLPDTRQVWRYAPNTQPLCLRQPESLGDDRLLPGLRLPLATLWESRL